MKKEVSEKMHLRIYNRRNSSYIQIAEINALIKEKVGLFLERLSDNGITKVLKTG
jgi:hypothetical protein